MPKRTRGANSTGPPFRGIRASRGFCRSSARTTRSKTSFIEARKQKKQRVSRVARAADQISPLYAEKFMSIDQSPEVTGHAGHRLEELTRRGASRRNVLRAMAASGLLSITGAGL